MHFDGHVAISTWILNCTTHSHAGEVHLSIHGRVSITCLTCQRRTEHEDYAFPLDVCIITTNKKYMSQVSQTESTAMITCQNHPLAHISRPSTANSPDQPGHLGKNSRRACPLRTLLITNCRYRLSRRRKFTPLPYFCAIFPENKRYGRKYQRHEAEQRASPVDTEGAEHVHAEEGEDGAG